MRIFLMVEMGIYLYLSVLALTDVRMLRFVCVCVEGGIRSGRK